MTPFVLSGPIGSGAVLWSNVLSGLVVMGLAAWNGYETQQATT